MTRNNLGYVRKKQERNDKKTFRVYKKKREK